MPSEKKADQGSDSTLSEASLDALKDAKNGKARKFVMTCKGVNIVALVVFKKGGFEKYKKEAKEAGTGQLYYGVITGKGENLSFQLSRSEGFDKSPIKSLTLKSYLDDEGGFKCKPLLEVVDTTPLVLDPDGNPLVARFLALQDSIQAACEQHPDRAAALATLTRQIGLHLDAEENDVAATKLDELQSLLATLSKTETGPTTSSTSAAPTGTDASATDAATWERALADYKPRWERAVNAGTGDVSKLRTLMTYAEEKADAGEFAKAIVGLKRMDELLAATSEVVTNRDGETAPVVLKPFSLVNAQAARIAWDKIRKQVQEELQGLEKTIRKAIESHNEDPEAEGEYAAEDVDGAAGELHRILDVLDQRLIVKLDAALQAEGAKREAFHRESVEIIKEYRAYVDTSKLMKRIDPNPFLSCSIKKRVDAALAALEKTL